MAFEHCIYACFVCLCAQEEKGSIKGCETGGSNQKSGLHSHCAANKMWQGWEKLKYLQTERHLSLSLLSN